MKVIECMTTKIEIVDADASVYDAVERMVDRRIRSLVVRFQGEEPDYGVITARDVVFKVLARGEDPRRIKNGEIASRPLVCMSPDTELREVANRMETSNIARVFIREDKDLIGVVALLDVMAATLIARARGDYVS